LALRSENKYLTAEDGDSSPNAKSNDDLSDIKSLIQQGKEIDKNQKNKVKDFFAKAFKKNSELTEDQSTSSNPSSPVKDSSTAAKRVKKAGKVSKEEAGDSQVSTWTSGGWTNPFLWLGLFSFAGIFAFSFLKFKPRFFSRR
jgi:pantothenate synthetase